MTAALPAFSVAEKAPYCCSLLAVYRYTGPETWARFNEQRPEYQLWYYGTLA